MPLRLCTLILLTLVGLSGADEADPRPVEVRFSGRLWDNNHQTTVPVGLFGLHAGGLTAELVEDLGVTTYRDIHFVPGGGSRVWDHRQQRYDEVRRGLDILIDCHGDRFYEPLPLRHRDHAEHAARLGRAYGNFWLEHAGSVPHSGIGEWWNEPYLNWAERSAGERGSTINQQWYDLDQAVEGGPVTIKGWDEPLRHFRWRSRWPVRYEERTDRQGQTRQVRIIGWNIPIPEGLEDGDQFEAAETRYWRDRSTAHTWTIERHWYPEDPTARFFWSGQQNLDFYAMSFEPWATALRETNPAVTILAGWDFNYSAGGWAVWTELYRPLLERFPTLIDGLTEHHYGIPPLLIQAWYELGTGEAMRLTGRWIRTWNTECQGRLDPAVYGRSHNASGGAGGAEQDLMEARYNILDIVGLAARMPATVGSRTMHNFQWNQGLERFLVTGGASALRLLRDLRGPLIHLEVDDQGLMAVAAQRPDGTAVLALVNARSYPMRVTLQPPGTTSIESRRLVIDPERDVLTTEVQTLTPSQAGWSLDLEAQDAVVCLLDALTLSGTTWTRQCFIAEPALRRAQAETALISTIALDADLLEQARSARLRLVSQGVPASGLRLRVNNSPGQQVHPDLPVYDLPIDLASLTAGDNRLVIEADGPWLLVIASVLLDGEQE